MISGRDREQEEESLEMRSEVAVEMPGPERQVTSTVEHTGGGSGSVMLLRLWRVLPPVLRLPVHSVHYSSMLPTAICVVYRCLPGRANRGGRASSPARSRRQEEER